MTSKFRNRTIQVVLVFVVFLFFQLTFRWEVLSHGRLLAEEGSLWWAHSLDSNVLSTLFFVPPLTGYFLLNTNLLMLFANVLPLSFLALTTTWVSLFVQTQVALVFLMLTKNREWKFRIFVFSIILFSPIFTDAETFANSINSQTYLAFIPILYLAMWVSPSDKFSKTYIYVCLFIAFFSGWYSAVLFPLLLLRLILSERTAFHKKVVATSFVALLLQIFVFFYQRQSGLLWPGKGTIKSDFREVYFDVSSIMKFAFTGAQGISPIATQQLLGIAVFAIGVAIASRLKFNSREKLHQRKGFWFLLAFLIEYLLVYFGDAAPGQGLWGRYLMVPSGTLILYVVIVSGEKLAKGFTKMPLVFFSSIVIGISYFQYDISSTHPLLKCANPCLSWSANVEKVSVGDATAFYFWPFNEGNPDWAISSITPKVRLAPFQGAAMGVIVESLPPISTVN